mgnify:FL=1
MKFKWALAAIPVFLLLSGCEERYRYPCQDPDNWNTKQCQKPYCSANGTCPEDLTHYDKDKVNGAPKSAPAPQQSTNAGACK